MWAAGNKRALANGFTLLELLVVLTIIAIGSAGAVFALRDSATTSLNREADRLAAVLEAVRAQSRSSGVALAWVALPQGFAVVPAQAVAALRNANSAGNLGLAGVAVNPWLAEGTTVQIQSGERSVQALLLGPEPMLPAQSLQLTLGEQRLLLFSDGLRPFNVQTSP